MFILRGEYLYLHVHDIFNNAIAKSYIMISI